MLAGLQNTLPVSIHAPAWGATFPPRWRRSRPTVFQSTHPRGVRPIWYSFFGGNRMFQSTHPRGVRRFIPTRLLWDKWVSIHAPAWGATGQLGPQPPIYMFQSTHPRGVRLLGHMEYISKLYVSIHAPAWGATNSEFGAVRVVDVFQSTHPRGVRRPAGGLVPGHEEFQSTHPRGVRRHCADCIPMADAVSIHAPAWGATTRQNVTPDTRPVSIHAPAWGATCRACRFVGASNGFQSTHPRGVRQEYAFAIEVTLQFQSTHPRGVRRQDVVIICPPVQVSIHAPAWGATRSDPSSSRPDPCFNPRTRVGCDGERKRQFSGVHEMFQSTHPRGVRPSTDGRPFSLASFNPRTRVGCDTWNASSYFIPL